MGTCGRGDDCGWHQHRHRRVLSRVVPLRPVFPPRVRLVECLVQLCADGRRSTRRGRAGTVDDGVRPSHRLAVPLRWWCLVLQVHRPVWLVLGAATRAPLVVACLLLCHGALMIMLAQPRFEVALLGQTLMGTVYVFFEQTCQEMIVVHAGGSQTLYRHPLSVKYLVFTAGCALGTDLELGPLLLAWCLGLPSRSCNPLPTSPQ